MHSRGVFRLILTYYSYKMTKDFNQNRPTIKENSRIELRSEHGEERFKNTMLTLHFSGQTLAMFLLFLDGLNTTKAAF